ncbi:unnamed protein product [Cylindrotheca closterium]|uniref:Uncharacterized protein n=1 Tax=Cylindrotheca closterium TaxID=2856 RepID=A0AAD2FT67_9STRA|nr:unnamed protein product [Cylindrotheca closterium]
MSHHLIPENNRILAKLVDLASPDESDENVGGSNSMPNTLISYMHEAPRFGHSNRLGIIASTNPEDPMEYASGLKQFTLFTLIPFVLWALLLLAFKYLYGAHKVGCAAGGQVVDIRKLAKRGVSRKTRRQHIVRNWRVQAMFLVVGLAIPTLTLILVKVGWGHMDTAMKDVKETLDDVESWSFNGQNIIERLKQTERNIRQHEFVQQALDLSTPKESTVFDEWCPNQRNSSLALLKESFVQVQSFAIHLEDEYARYVPNDIAGFQTITEIASDIEGSLNRVMDNDWMFKFFLMVLNVINLLMVLICQVCSRNNIIHPPTRAYTTWLILPVFFVLTTILMAITAVSGIAALFNADFCSGGEEGSPQGTFYDAILSYEHGSLDASIGPDDSMELVYDSFKYYSGGCLTEHPLDFLEEFGARIGDGVSQLTHLSNALIDAQNETFLIDSLSAECGADVSFLPATIGSLDGLFHDLQDQMDAYVDLISCSRVSPIIRRVTNGAICNESVKGATSIWACSFSLLLCCFTMLSLRAALFNSIKRGRKRDKKPKRVVEKEFEEYKEFMKEYYGDEVGKWKAQGVKLKSQINHVEFDLGSQFIESKPTFDTEGSSPDSARGGVFTFEYVDNGETGTEIAPVMEDPTANGEEAGEDEASSYESCSDEESEANADLEDDKSALVSFFVETKVMARHGIQNVRDFGSTVSDNVSAIGLSPMNRSGSADDASVLSSLSSRASSFASSVVHRTFEKVKKLKPLLGGDEEDHGPDDSIDEESLFISPTNDTNVRESQVVPLQSSKLIHSINDSFERELEEVFEKQGRHEAPGRSSHERKGRESAASTTRSLSTHQGFDRVWKMISPVSDLVYDTSPRELKRVKTPTAPKKAIQFLSRTRNEYDEDEIQPLTPNRAQGSVLSMNSNVQPTRLRLSPYHYTSNDSNTRQRKRARHQSRTRLSLDDDDESDHHQRQQRQEETPISPPKNDRFTSRRRY